jgi:hypothetical protein
MARPATSLTKQNKGNKKRPGGADEEQVSVTSALQERDWEGAGPPLRLPPEPERQIEIGYVVGSAV